MPSIRELRDICQNSSQAPSWRSQTFYGRLNRFWAIYLTWIFIRLPFTPNQITIAGTAVFLAGAACFLGGTRAWNLAGILLIMFSYALDAVDGELARYRKLPSKFDMGGVYVEPVSHDVQYGWMFLPIALGVFFKTGSPWAFVAGFAATSGKLLFRLLEFRYDAFRRYADETRGTVYGWVTKRSTPSSFLYLLYRNTAVTTGTIPLLLVASIVDRVDLFLYGYGAFLFALWLALFFRNARRVNATSAAAQSARTARAIFQPKAVLFDFDGTLVDTMGRYADIAAEVMAEHFAADRAWAREKYIETSGVPFVQQLGTIFPGDPRIPNAAAAFEHHKNQFLETFPMPEETLAVLAELRNRGIAIGVSSNNFQASVDRFIERARLPFSCVMGYREGFRKGEQHLRHFQEKSGVRPPDMLLVGDSLHDAAIALENGIGFVAKEGTFNRKVWNERYPHVVVIGELRELLPLVQESSVAESYA